MRGLLRHDSRILQPVASPTVLKPDRRFSSRSQAQSPAQSPGRVVEPYLDYLPLSIKARRGVRIQCQSTMRRMLFGMCEIFLRGGAAQYVNRACP
jgi:hypothetical protein